ncbi:dihydroneopterin aldolase [Acidocella aminolytica]|uniref:7,8-dihydroneopterin aldolase n=1 Tax=Acidocella aminolytica 101 = DSM 11237 TaxID=1120923 RepID=A0A0D6PJG2_9PROT|nr:dihydroneopterin aldolase [Acidocella aminolytica]GAN81910.1 dihydroneopterin aldolase [Acidocella aminolytica 101 = DSM 11237]GBQ42649.1 dihydroneopterin aldolase [Acidocella aminolytica 101 = DSM 11237]SHF21015.1 dihydroneopterin aldolase [Acidocella aminolytica 101 = DSM 11237]
MDHFRLADAACATRRMFVRDLLLDAQIGVYAHEHGRTQRVRVNLDLAVEDDGAANISRPAVGADDLGRVVDYDTVINAVRQIIAAGHVQLVETLAERVAEACLANPRVRVARVMVEKLDVIADAASVGVEIERRNS